MDTNGIFMNESLSDHPENVRAVNNQQVTVT